MIGQWNGRVGALLAGVLGLFVSGCVAVEETVVPEEAAPGTAYCGGAVMAKGMAAPVPVALPAADIAGGEARFAVDAERKMSYRAVLRLNCLDVAAALRDAGAIAKKYGGYVAASDDSAVTLKIPVEKADAALAEFEKLGVVVSRRIAAQDVTEQCVDTEVRLDNLRKLHGKLTELLKRAEKVGDALAIERELARVTTELERYQAMMKNLALRIAMVEMQLEFNMVTPVDEAQAMIPIPWVTTLGTEVARSEFPLNFNDRQPFDITLPPGFAVLSGGRERLYAVNADDVVIALARYRNHVGADLDFYRRMIERNLFELNSYARKTVESATIDSLPAAVIVGTRPLAGGRVEYEADVIVYDDGWFFDNTMVYVLEIWGRPDALGKVDRAALRDSIRL